MCSILKTAVLLFLLEVRRGGDETDDDCIQSPAVESSQFGLNA